MILPSPIAAEKGWPRRLLDGLYLGAGYLAGAFLVAIFALMMSLAVGREVGWSISAGDAFASWRLGDMSQGVVAVPLWIPQLGMAAGLVILFVAFVDELVHVLAGHLPHYEKPPPATPEEVIARAIESGV